MSTNGWANWRSTRIYRATCCKRTAGAHCIMANKTLRTRQKALFRTALVLTPRNPLAAAAKLRAAGPRRKTTSAQREVRQRTPKKILAGSGSDEN